MALSIGVAEYYAGKTIFVTGATGFMGKVLVEKLLRCCPDIKKIYLLIRQKKGKDVEQRIKDLVACHVFDNLHDTNPKCFSKLQVISGDVLLDDLGISIEDRQTLQNDCQIVFHCAASVRFDSPIRNAVHTNTFGTYKVLKLSEGMKNIEVFLHISTSYCHCELKVLEEKLYPLKYKPQQIMECVGWMDDDLLKHLEPALIKPQPNTYAYTKSLTEDLVSQYAEKFPIGIARPSIVTAAFREPIPGWVDNLNGVTGVLVGLSKGVLRTILNTNDSMPDVIPVDLAVNGCILLAYTTAQDKSKQVRICNITQSGMNQKTWKQFLDTFTQHIKEYPHLLCFWYPRGRIVSTLLEYEIFVFLKQMLPAYIIDFLMILMLKKPFMVQLQKRIRHGQKLIQYYTTKEWRFINDNFRALRKSISKSDDEVFYTDIEALNFNEYVKIYMKGARQYCCKEDPATLPKAKRLYSQLFYLDLMVKMVVYGTFIYFIYNYIISIIFTY